MGHSFHGQRPKRPTGVVLMPSQKYDEYEWEAAKAYARALNNLDCSLLKPLLDRKAIYESQHVFEPLVGQAKILEYLEGKFTTLSKAGVDRQAKAEMAWMNSTYVGRPAVILHQGGGPVAVVLFTTAGGRIARIDICGVLPRVDEATGTGEYPT